MRNSNKLEEFLVWPPIGVGTGSLVGFTIYDSLKSFHETIVLIEGAYLLAGYLFPIFMGIGITWRLHGKYWLGFGWLSLATYCLALITRLFDLSGNLGIFYTVLIMFTILLTTQTIILYLKRFGFKRIQS